MVGLVKNALYKTVGKSKLEWHELAEVLTDIEKTLNNRPLTCMEKDIEFLVLVPNSLVFGQQLIIPNEDPENIEDKDLRKRQKYIQKCKEVAWKRWRSEYLTSLRERHNSWMIQIGGEYCKYLTTRCGKLVLIHKIANT